MAGNNRVRQPTQAISAINDPSRSEQRGFWLDQQFAFAPSCYGVAKSPHAAGFGGSSRVARFLGVRPPADVAEAAWISRRRMSMPNRFSTCLLIFGFDGGAVGGSSPLFAQTGIIRVIVGTASGGAIDPYARL